MGAAGSKPTPEILAIAARSVEGYRPPLGAVNTV
jgi:hypothetical protein